MTATATRRRRRQPAAAAALTDGALLASSSSGRVAGELRHLPLDAIDPGLNPNPRGDVDTTSDAFAAFLESIRASGVLQPVGAHPHPDDPERVALTMGWRRYTAATMAELDTIPVYVTALTGSALVRAIAENSAREDLTPLQEAHAIKTLMDEEDLTQAEAGKLIGRSERTVRSRLQLLKLTPKVAAAIDTGKVPAYAAPVMQTIGATCPRFADDLVERIASKDLAASEIVDGDLFFDALWRANAPIQRIDAGCYVDFESMPDGAEDLVATDLRHGLRWDKTDVAAARKAGVVAEPRFNDDPADREPAAFVEDEDWLRGRLPKVAERAAKERAEADAQREAYEASVERDAEDQVDEETSSREDDARVARTVQAAHRMNLELGREILAHKPKASDVAPLLAVLAIAPEAARAAAAAYHLIDERVQTLVAMGPDDRWDDVKVPTFEAATTAFRKRVNGAKDPDKARVLIAGVLAALWADPRAAFPSSGPTGRSWTWEAYRLPADVHAAAAAYAARAGIKQPARMKALDAAVAEYQEATRVRDAAGEQLRLLHELTVNDDGLDIDTLISRVGNHAYGFGDGVAYRVTSGKAADHIKQLVELGWIALDEDKGHLAIADAGRDRLAAGATPAPELRDVDADLPLVYPPGTDDQADDDGELVVEGRTRGEQALSAIRQRPGITIPELAEALGVKQNYMYRVLPALEQDGKVVKRGRGWHTAEEGTTDA